VCSFFLVESFRNRRAIDLIKNIYRTSGIRGFYKGTSNRHGSNRIDTFIRCFLGISASYVGVSETIVHFVIYEQIKAHLQQAQISQHRSTDDPDLISFLTYLAAAACSKSCASTLCYPHEVLRTRLREEGTKYRTLVQTLRTVWHEESIAGFYRGLLTHLIRQIPVRNHQ
jgi:solute carrier family 25, member 33/36